MSSGQRPRTREYFPRMKVRGRRRRARAQVLGLAGIDWGELAAGFVSILDTVGAAVVAGLNQLASVAEGWARVSDRVMTQWHDYLSSERYQLDLIAAQYQGDPMGHSAAVGEFFTARAHRELDELAADILQPRLAPWQLKFIDQLYPFQRDALGPWLGQLLPLTTVTRPQQFVKIGSTT